MHAECTPAPAAKIPATTLQHGVYSWTNVLTRLGSWWRNRRAINELNEMDDHQLFDIGLTQGDIDRARRLPLSADPIMHLAAARRDTLRGVRHR